MMDLLTTHLQVMDWMTQAADHIRRHLGEALQVEEKSAPNDLVTNVDQETEQFLVGKIREAFPDHKILGEEGFGDQVTTMDGWVWLIDPIDGTLNFIKKQTDFGMMIALYHNGVGQLGYLYDVMRDQLIFGIKDKGAYFNNRRLQTPPITSLSQSVVNSNGNTLMDATPELKDVLRQALATRTVGAASLEQMQVFLGQSAAYFSRLLAPWDCAAGMVVAQELGLHYSTLSGEPVNLVDPSKRVTGLIASHQVAEQLLPALKTIL